MVKKAGAALYTKKDSVLFKRKNLIATEAFYHKHGGKALVLGRFLPIIRTFAPVLAGVINIDVKKFMLYNVIGAVLWIASLSAIGYFLGMKFPQIEQSLGYIVIALVVVTSLPILTTYLKQKKKAKSA